MIDMLWAPLYADKRTGIQKSLGLSNIKKRIKKYNDKWSIGDTTSLIAVQCLKTFLLKDFILEQFFYINW